MPEETAQAATEAEAKTEEPQGTDWKAEARKWEARAKENKRTLDDVQRKLEGFETAKQEDDAREQRASEALEAAKAEIKRLTAEAERDKTVREVAKAQSVDADILLLMRGDTKEEIEANAKLLSESSKRRWPEVKDGGQTKAPRITREDILAERNPQKQLRMIAENKDLFGK